ncbi:hypothetical protein [Metapseudomonas furukawaii]|uniref:Uncharacterized protein n=1 Tax=Metapseudomonas furukawaii TaxID=1149133 RepID=A0AAD1C2D9_METFU|nr:hypothetical protein [Pseudomonas furukawaii]ELS25685.1 hypothetical protein ppKF707_0781 [Pseudomonas furukawaii]BAU76126.1 hypothetical protein KF707C_44380 [Pseudomonas furukawaii]
MTLAEERAAIRTGVTAARTSTLRRDLNSLETQRRQVQALNTLERKGARPSTKGRGTWDPARATTGTGGGIASPLTETSYYDRTHWAERTLLSSDGLLSFRVQPIKEITQRDANDAEVKQVFADPSVTP